MKTIVMLSTVQAAINLAMANKIRPEIAEELHQMFQAGQKKEIKGIIYSIQP